MIEPKGRTFRSTGAVAAGWALVVFAVLNLGDVAVRGRDLASLVAAAVLLFGCAVAYALLLRPRIVADETRVRFVNPLRTVTVPWGAVDDMELSRDVEAITVVTGGRRVRAWALQGTSGARRRRRRRTGGGRGRFVAAEPLGGAAALSRKPRFTGESGGVPDGVADAVLNRTHIDFVLEQLTELRATHLHQARRDEPAPGGAAEQPQATVSWAPAPVAALAGTGIAMLAVISVAVLR